MNEEKKLKPLVVTENDETHIPIFVADIWNTSHSRHIFLCFILVAIILLYFSFLTPNGKSTIFTTTKLPVYAASGPFDVKLELNEISPFSQRISVETRFISDLQKGQFTTNGSCLFTPKQKGNHLESKIIHFSSQTFNFSDKSNQTDFVELLDSSRIY